MSNDWRVWCRTWFGTCFNPVIRVVIRAVIRAVIREVIRESTTNQIVQTADGFQHRELSRYETERHANDMKLNANEEVR